LTITAMYENDRKETCPGKKSVCPLSGGQIDRKRGSGKPREKPVEGEITKGPDQLNLEKRFIGGKAFVTSPRAITGRESHVRGRPSKGKNQKDVKKASATVYAWTQVLGIRDLYQQLD